MVLVAGLAYFGLTEIVGPRGPGPRDAGDGGGTVGGGPADPDAPGIGTGDSPDGTGAGSAGGRGAGPVEEEGFPPMDRKSSWELTGEVRDHEGKPVRAKVHVDWARIGRLPVGTLETDSKGAFSGYLPEPGKYAVTADRDGTRVTQVVNVEGEEASVVVTLVFPGTSSISGVVKTEFGPLATDVRGEETVPGQEPLTVDLVPVGDGEALECLVDADGRYRIVGAAAGEYFLRVRSKWFVTRVTLEADDEKTLDVVLPGGRIHGRVVDSLTGLAPEGVQVVLQWTGPGGALAGDHEKAGFATVSDRCSPDANGDYSFENLPPGAYRLFSNGHWYNVVPGEATLSEEKGEARVDFDLEKGSVVVLSITDLDGVDVPRPFCMTQGILWGFTGHVSGLKAVTSDVIAGGAGFEFQRQSVAFKPGEATPAKFRLAPEAATKLVFVDPDGTPVVGARVVVPWGAEDIQRLSAAFRRGSGLPFSETDGGGAVWIFGVRAGPCEVKVRKNGFAAFDGTVSLPEGGGEVKVTLTPGDDVFDFRLVVVRTAPDGQAAKLGVKPGDSIRAVDGKAVGTRKELGAAIAAAKAAGKETVTLTVRQGVTTTELVFRTGTLGVSLEERF